MQLGVEAVGHTDARSANLDEQPGRGRANDGDERRAPGPPWMRAGLQAVGPSEERGGGVAAAVGVVVWLG